MLAFLAITTFDVKEIYEYVKHVPTVQENLCN